MWVHQLKSYGSYTIGGSEKVQKKQRNYCVEASSVSNRITNKSKHQFILLLVLEQIQKKRNSMPLRCWICVCGVERSETFFNCYSLWEVVAVSANRVPSHIWSQTVTWLILPVVICLSQRLSHACLSINIFIQWNCVQLIISVIIYLMVPYYMDTRSNSRANTCVKSRLLGRDVFIR